jgi:hypothetical protein
MVVLVELGVAPEAVRVRVAVYVPPAEEVTFVEMLIGLVT